MRKVEKRLRELVKILEENIAEKDKDLEVFRNHFASRMRLWIQLLGEGKTPNLPWMIEDDAKRLHRLKSWWW